MRLLHIDSSPLGDASVSRTLTASIVETWVRENPGIEVVTRDLAASPVQHLSANILHAISESDPSVLSEGQVAERALSEELIDEFLSADVIVIGAPMYNFSIPTQLKSWIDRIARAGRTFRYTETGPVGLSGGRKVILAISRGSVFGDSAAMLSLDHQESYLRTVFGFLGITDIEAVRAEGIGLGPDARASAIGAAKTRIEALIPVLAA